MTVYGVPVLLPSAEGSEALLRHRLESATRAPVFRGLSAGELLPLALTRLRKKPVPDSNFPRTRFLAAWLRFCTGKQVRAVACPEIFLDLLALGTAQGREILFLTGTNHEFQEFRRQVGRMFPGLRLGAHLEARMANARPEDTVAFLKKIHPWAVYLGPDVERRSLLAERIVGEIDSVKAVLLGRDEFALYTRPASDGPTGPRLLSEFFEDLRRHPLGLWRLLPAAFLIPDALRVKLFRHYKVEAS